MEDKIEVLSIDFDNVINSKYITAKTNYKFSIEKLSEAIDYYIEVTNRRVTFEYIMLSGVNDRPEHARELVALLKDKKKLVYVNLIPYNPVSEHDQYSRSSKDDVLKFYDILKKGGINCVIRQEHGTDIDAACGQLRSKTMKADKKKQPDTKEFDAVTVGFETKIK